jgi:hypothetical protein
MRPRLDPAAPSIVGDEKRGENVQILSVREALRRLQLKDDEGRLAVVPGGCRESSGPLFIRPSVASIVRSLPSEARSLESRALRNRGRRVGEAQLSSISRPPASLPSPSVSLS